MLHWLWCRLRIWGPPLVAVVRLNQRCSVRNAAGWCCIMLTFTVGDWLSAPG